MAGALRRAAGLAASTKPASAATIQNTRRPTTNAFWRCSISQFPPGYARWTGPLIAAALGDVGVQYVWRFLRAHKIDLAARKSWCESNDPAFAAKAAASSAFI